MARLGNGPLAKLPGPLSGWTTMRDLPEAPQQTFREWWRARATP
jgi:L-lactate dehydrogenase complex protein LldF